MIAPIKYLIDTLMIPFLSFSYHSIYPNYGVAIILLTLLIKVLFAPLTKKQFESMKKTQEIQPEIKKIQEKFKDQPEKVHQEMMKIWKEKKVNPLGGCLPAVVQLPFFIAVFYTVSSESFKALLASPGVNQGMFSFWLADLTAPDATYIMPVIIGILTYFTSKMMSPSGQKQPAFMAIMPVFMVVICLRMPAGVLLYWVSSQLISSIQQYLVVKKGVSKTDKVKKIGVER